MQQNHLSGEKSKRLPDALGRVEVGQMRDYFSDLCHQDTSCLAVMQHAALNMDEAAMKLHTAETRRLPTHFHPGNVYAALLLLLLLRLIGYET